MKTNFFRPLFFAACALIPLAISCNLLKNQVDRVDTQAMLRKTQPSLDSLARSMGVQLMLGVNEETPRLTKSILSGLKGATDTLDPDIQKIMRTLDSLGTLSNEQLNKLGDNFEMRVSKLKDDLKDEELKKFLIGTIESMTGKLKKDTKSLLSDMIQSSLDELGSASSKEKIRLIINNILSDDTKQQAQSLVQTALQPTMDTLLKRIDKIVHKDVPFVQRQANKLLWTLGLLSAGIIGLVWYQRRKYARLVSLLTYEIDKIPSQQAYDELTQKIKNEAQKTGLEPLLRETLKEQGINS